LTFPQGDKGVSDDEGKTGGCDPAHDHIVHPGWEGAIASEDLLALGTARELGLEFEEKILVGSPDRCAVYRYLMEQEGIGGKIRIADETVAERATVRGSLKVMTEQMSGA